MPRAPSAPPSRSELVPSTAAGSGADLTAEAGRPRPRVVAVTGAAGFLGRNLIGSLEEDGRVGRVVAIDIQPASKGSKGAKTRHYQIDLTEPTTEARVAEIFAAERVDTVVHLAFLASPTHATAWAHELESVGTMHVTVAARQARVRKLVLGSQTWLYGATPSNPNFLTEKHPLRAPAGEPFFADKIEAEEQARKLAQRAPGTVVTILRAAPILGPNVHNAVTRYLARRLVPTMMGFDPLVQFLHELDAIAALHLSVIRDVPGTFNIVADGVLPLSTVIKLAGRVAVPIPHPIAEAVAAAAWAAQLGDAPPAFLRYLRFLCVGDGRRAREHMGFRPVYTSREALLDFVSAQRLRDVKLLTEESAA
ncbi:MAG: NAD-dependent epimerase/dehydratase family protein [Myxococcales bacterium]|nr:NAD-dependent epimerase/dehydratase family protein [Myxococcales bacterium]